MYILHDRTGRLEISADNRSPTVTLHDRTGRLENTLGMVAL